MTFAAPPLAQDNDLGLRAASWSLFGFAAFFKAVTGIWMPRVLPAARSCGVAVVVGEAIPVPRRGPNGWTEEEADALHATYVKALQALYASHVDKYGGPMAPKEIQLVG